MPTTDGARFNRHRRMALPPSGSKPVTKSLGSRREIRARIYVRYYPRRVVISFKRRVGPGPSRLTLDESEIGNVSVVGGFIVAAAAEVAVVDAWRRHKKAIGLAESNELKFNAPESALRQRLDAAGFTQRERVPLALQAIASTPLRLIAAVTVVTDQRPRVAYLDGLDWCLTRFRDFVTSRPMTSGHQVVIDQPSGLSQGPLCSTLMSSPQDSPFALYERRWSTARLHQGDGDAGRPLGSLGFSPELSVSCSSYSDLLQIADHIAGCTAQFVARYLDRPNDSAWRDSNFCIIAPRFWRGLDHIAIGVRPSDVPGRDAIEQALEVCSGLASSPAREPSRSACCGRDAIRGGQATAATRRC